MKRIKRLKFGFIVLSVILAIATIGYIVLLSAEKPNVTLNNTVLFLLASAQQENPVDEIVNEIVSLANNDRTPTDAIDSARQIFVTPDLEQIKRESNDRQSPHYFRTLAKRFAQADTSLTIEEMQATQEDSMKREEEFYRELKEMEAINRTLEQQASLQDNEIENLKTKYNTSNKLVMERENYEQNLYNIVSAAIVTTTDDGTIQYVNELFISLMGYKSAEVIGRSIYNILGFESSETEMAKALQAEYGNIVNNKGREVKVKNKKGEKIKFWLSITANIFNTKVVYTFVLNDLTNLVLEQAKELAQRGYREIVVTGIEISSWGLDFHNGSSLKDLIAALS